MQRTNGRRVCSKEQMEEEFAAILQCLTFALHGKGIYFVF